MPKVLAVDNEEEVIREIVDYLSKEGWDTDFATNGEEALDRLAAGPPVDAVVLDRRMPVMDGEATLREIRRQARFDSICVVMLTAYGDITNAVRALRMGAYQYLEQPFPMGDLHKILVSGVAWQKAHSLRQRLITTFSADSLFAQIRDIIADTFRPSELSILFLNSDGTVVAEGGDGRSELTGGRPEFVRRIAKARHPVLASGDIQMREWQPVLQDAQCLLAAPILDGSGVVIGVLDLESTKADAFDRNWVDVVAYLADLAGLALEIGKAERAKREQLVQVAREARHHFATPAQVIQMQAEQFISKELAHLSGDARASALNRLNVIKDNADAITAACGYLEDISRDVPLSRSKFDLRALLRVCGDEFRPEFEAKKICLSVEGEDDKPVEIDADPLRIRYSVQCLLKNAIEAIEERRDQVLDTQYDIAAENDRVSISVNASDPSWATIRIEDTGTGILPSHEAQIFQPLFSTRRSPQRGGFGLYSVRRIVENHRGKIHFSSKLGEGTVFTLSLPRN